MGVRRGGSSTRGTAAQREAASVAPARSASKGGETAFLSMTEVEVGLAGGVRHVLRHFGHSDALLMIYTARRITGPELLRMNVVSACVPGPELMGIALGPRDRGQGAACHARRGALLHLDGGVAASRGLPLRAVADRRPGGHRGHQGGAARLAEKRKPVFTGRWRSRPERTRTVTPPRSPPGAESCTGRAEPGTARSPRCGCWCSLRNQPSAGQTDTADLSSAAAVPQP
jgi:hypothetical protein